MYSRKPKLYFLKLFTDILVIIMSFNIAAVLSIHNSIALFNPQFHSISLVMLITWYFYANSIRLYDDLRARNVGYELTSALKSITFQIIISIVIIFLFNEGSLGRVFIIVYSISLLVLVPIEKLLIRKFLNTLRKKGRNSRNMLIIGAGRNGVQFYETIRDNPHYGYNLIGFLDDQNKSYLKGNYLGCIDQLESILSKNKIDDVIIALPESAVNKCKFIQTITDKYPVRLQLIPDLAKYSDSKYEINMVSNIPVLSVQGGRLLELEWRLFKRLFDLTFSILVIIFLFSWLFPLIFILQKIFNPGPLFYRGIRWGRGGEPFYCIKFRSMKIVENNSEHKITERGDPRLTKFGAFLRKSNIDELPQFFNVLYGDMSVVGPRPHDKEENIILRDELKNYMQRHLVKPGITGWAQVHNYRGGTTNMKLMQKRTELDLWYIDNWSFWLDVQIILMTLWQFIKGDPNAY